MTRLGESLLVVQEVTQASPPLRAKSLSALGSPGQVKRTKSKELPDLRDRIQKLGLTEEYLAFKDRYLSWRQGSPTGARGEITHERITRPEHVAANRGFGHWYPTVQEWLWKRTMSYWIAVTFFEGSLFFAISSFMYNERAVLKSFYEPLTFYGYCAGKVFFFTCTYFMCLECINFRAENDGAEGNGDEGKLMSPETAAPFYLWPFRSTTALRNLRSAGAGPWPWYTSANYFLGVLAFTVGLVAEVIPGLLGPFWEVWLFDGSFLVGSLFFFIGGVAECIQNEVFSSLDISMGWLGALLNLGGGVGFLAGSIMTILEEDQRSNDSYGWGAVLYAASSSIQIIMWKDEQFGLTFLSVINRLGPDRDTMHQGDHSRFSVWGVITVHACCICGALSTYNFNIKLMQMDTWRSFQYAFNEFLPCLFAHMMLLLCSAVMQTPKVSPFRQLYLGVRMIMLVLTVNSISTFVEFVSHSISS